MKKRRSLLRRRGSKAKEPSEEFKDELEEAAQVTVQHEQDEIHKVSSITTKPQEDTATIPKDTPGARLPSDPAHPLFPILIPVSQACEDIWKCQEPEQAAAWLQLLHHALLRPNTAGDTPYIPSEVFMCISGAALRFHTATTQQDTNVVWEEAMWAVAALARVCVGPAWRLQLRRLYYDSGNDDESDSHRSYSPITMPCFGRGKISRDSPMIPENLPAAMLRFGATAVDSNMEDATRKTSLAEAQRELVLALCFVLPEEEEDYGQVEWSIVDAHNPVATMVRFWLETLSSSDGNVAAERNDEKESSTAHSENKSGPQDDDDTSLSRLSVDSESKSVPQDNDVSLPSAVDERSGNEKVQEDGPPQMDVPMTDGASQVKTRVSDSSGLNVLNIQEVDWWTTLQVVRACFQLVSAGWRLPQTETGEHIVKYLLKIVEKGMMLHASQLTSNESRDAREERLAASSSVLVALTVLSSIASIGLVPCCMQSIMVQVLCRLQVAAKSNSSLELLFPAKNPGSAAGEEEWKADRHAFMEQREESISDIAALQWVLLAHRSSAANAMTTLSESMLSVVNPPSPSEIVKDTAEEERNVEPVSPNAVATACVAVEVVSGSIWGNEAADVPGIASLRICWYQVLDMMNNLVSTAHDRIAKDLTSVMKEDADIKSENGAIVLHFLSVVKEVIIALKRFVGAELLRGEGLLAQDEWELLVTIMDENIDKWLCTPKSDVTTVSGILDAIRSEAESLLSEFRDFLENCADFEGNSFNLIADDSTRVKLYTALLRKSVPCLPPEEGTPLALAVVRSWSAVGFSQPKSNEWARTGSLMITEVFAVFEGPSFGRFSGYVHSPSVRLEALKSIALGQGQDEGSLDFEHFDMTPHLSPLELTKHMREQHLALINTSLFPPLMKMFAIQPPSESRHTELVIPLPVQSVSSGKALLVSVSGGKYVQRSESELSKDELELYKFAITLLGRLFRSVASESRYRNCVLDMLRSAAITGATDVRQSTSADQMDSISGDEPITSLPGSFQISLGAVRELEKCMCLPFGDHPRAHESLPLVVDALCSILSAYGDTKKQPQDLAGLMVKRYLALIVVLSLGRLGSSCNMRLILGEKFNVARLVPKPLAPLLFGNLSKEKLKDGEQGQPTLVAPFIVVSSELERVPRDPSSRAPRSTVGTTQFSFNQIFAAIMATLRNSIDSRQSLGRQATSEDSEGFNRAIESLGSSLRSVSYDALGRFVQPGIGLSVPIGDILTILRSPCSVGAGGLEDLSRCRCASSMAEALVVKYRGAILHHADTPESVQIDQDCLSDIEDLLQHLMLYSTSHCGRRLVHGCRAIRGLISFIAENMPAFRITVYEDLLQRIRQEMVTPHDESEGIHVGEALVSALFDLLCSIPTRDDVGLQDIFLQTVVLCCDICMCGLSRMTQTCRLLSVRLSAAALDRLVVNDEAISKSSMQEIESSYNRLVSFLAQENDVDSAQYSLFAQCKLVSDLIKRKFIGGENKIDEQGDNSFLSHHEVLARETDDISRFVEESSDERRVTVVAWLFWNSILTCRIGSLSSRYRGWIEVVVRSATSRSRRLIRLPLAVSLDNPEIPSSLWSIASNEPASLFPADPGLSELDIRFTEDSAEMKKAISLIEKCDELFGRPSPDSQRSAVEETTSKAVVEPKSSVVDSNSASPNKPPPTGDSSNSVEEWLTTALGNEDQLQYVIEQLGKLGFTSEMLRYPRSKIQPARLGSYCTAMKRLSFDPKVARAISILDRTPILNTHKIALLFVAPSSTLEAEKEQSIEDKILSTTSGSPRFLKFAEELGSLVLTRHLKYYSGGLDTSGSDADGKLAFVHLDSLDRHARSMVVFHAVPLMPEGSNNRKRHIGNDNVHIVYIDHSFQMDQLARGDDYRALTSMVSGQLGFVLVFVASHASAAIVTVTIRLRDSLPESTKRELSHLVGEHTLSQAAAPSFVRQVATRADFTCRVIMEDHFGKLNWEERLEQISTMKRYVVVSR